MARTFTRQEFYDLVWSKPMTHLAKEFGLSDVALHKICKKHDVPKPPVGWWAKKAAGQKVRQTPLPDAKKGISDRIMIAAGQLSPESETLVAAREHARVVASETQVDAGEPDPIVERTISRLSKAKPSATGLVAVSGKGVIKCEVAPASLERLGVILNQLVSAARLHGFSLKSVEGDAQFVSDTESIGFLLTEGTKREKHVLTPDELAEDAAWERKQQKRNWDWRMDFERPRFAEWDYHPTGLIALEFENVYYPGGTSPRRSFRDAKIQRLETMAGDIAVGLAVLAAAKTEARLRREEARRQEEERRRQRELALRAKHVEERRTKALSEILGEVADLDRLKRLLALLRSELDQADAPRVNAFLAWSEQHLERHERALATSGLEGRFSERRLFGDDDDHDFRPPMWY